MLSPWLVFIGVKEEKGKLYSYVSAILFLVFSIYGIMRNYINVSVHREKTLEKNEHQPFHCDFVAFWKGAL